MPRVISAMPENSRSDPRAATRVQTPTPLDRGVTFACRNRVTLKNGSLLAVAVLWITGAALVSGQAPGLKTGLPHPSLIRNHPAIGYATRPVFCRSMPSIN